MPAFLIVYAIRAWIPFLMYQLPNQCFVFSVCYLRRTWCAIWGSKAAAQNSTCDSRWRHQDAPWCSLGRSAPGPQLSLNLCSAWYQFLVLLLHWRKLQCVGLPSLHPAVWTEKGGGIVHTAELVEPWVRPGEVVHHLGSSLACVVVRTERHSLSCMYRNGRNVEYMFTLTWGTFEGRYLVVLSYVIYSCSCYLLSDYLYVIATPLCISLFLCVASL